MPTLPRLCMWKKETLSDVFFPLKDATQAEIDKATADAKPKIKAGSAEHMALLQQEKKLRAKLKAGRAETQRLQEILEAGQVEKARLKAIVDDASNPENRDYHPELAAA